MPYSYALYTGNGSNTDFVFSFPYLAQTHVKVYLNGVVQTTGYSFVTATGPVRFVAAPSSGVAVLIQRETPIGIGDRPVVFENGAGINEDDLNDAFLQNLYIQQEIEDSRDRSLRTTLGALNSLPSAEERSGKILSFDSGGQPVTSFSRADIVNEAAAAGQGSASEAAASALAAQASASAAETSAQGAAASADEAEAAADSLADLQAAVQSALVVISEDASSLTLGVGQNFVVTEEAISIALQFPSVPQVSLLKAEAIPALVVEVQKALYPIGEILTTLRSGNPSSWLGFGTWERFAEGRTLVGFNASDSDFDAAEKTGGAKTHTLSAAQLPAHTHSAGTLSAAASGTHAHEIALGTTDYTSGLGYGADKANTALGEILSTADAGEHTHTISGATGSVGSDQAHNNLQPFIVVFLWKRTA